MDSGISTTMRARKVIYDDYTNTFYVESRVEALERQVATRAKLTDVLNRSHDTKLRNHKKQVQNVRLIGGLVLCLPVCLRRSVWLSVCFSVSVSISLCLFLSLLPPLSMLFWSFLLFYAFI